MKFNQELIEKLRAGETSLSAIGDAESIRAILKEAFPDDLYLYRSDVNILEYLRVVALKKGYFIVRPGLNDKWTFDTSPKKVNTFNDFILPEACICSQYMGSDLLIDPLCKAKKHNHVLAADQFKWGEVVEVYTNESWTAGIYVAFDPDPVAGNYIVSLRGIPYTFKYCRKVPLTIKVTMQEIAEWKGCSIEQIKIVDYGKA